MARLRIAFLALLVALAAAAPASAAIVEADSTQPYDPEAWVEDGRPYPEEDDYWDEEDEAAADRWAEEAGLEDDWSQDVGAVAAPDAEGSGGSGAAKVRPAKVPYGRLIATTARRHKIPVALFTALVWAESNYHARARSPAGARGLTQLMPATARSLGVRNVYDPKQNLSGGARYLRQQLVRFRTKRLALAAYNAGPGNVLRYRGVPPFTETRTYVKKILRREAQLRRAGVR